MIFKRLKQLEWRVAELEIDQSLMLKEIEELKHPQLSSEENLERMIAEEAAKIK